MARIYTVSYNGTLTNAGGDTDLFELTPADDKPVRLRGLILSQYSEIGDAAEEGLRMNIIRMGVTVTTGSGGGTPTPIAIDETDAAAGFVAKCNNTTVATSNGTMGTVEEFAWNERISPMERWWPDDRYAPQVRQAGAIVVRCQTTAADDLSIAITAYVEEL